MLDINRPLASKSRSIGSVSYTHLDVYKRQVLVYGFSSGVEKIGVDLVEEVLRDRAEFGVLAYN